MSQITIQDAERLVPPPSWASAPDYRRKSDYDGASEEVFVFESATIVDTPLATVEAEWQTIVHADGSVEPTLESVKLITFEESSYLETAHLSSIIQALTQAAQLMGVAL